VTSVAPAGPQHLVIVLGWRCNSACPFCIRRELQRTHAAEKHEMTYEEFATGLTRYRSTLQSLALSSFGETMLNADFPAMIHLLFEEYGHLAAVHVITNGSLMDRCWDVGDLPGVLSFSIDSLDRETYAGMRPGLDYDVVVSNLRVMAQRPNHPRRRVGINMAVFERNKAHVYSMIQFAHAEGLSYVQVIAGMGVDGRDAVGAPPAPADPFVLAQVVRARADFPSVEVISDTFDISPVNRCRMPWTSMDIAPDGQAHPCCRSLAVGYGHWTDSYPWESASIKRLREQLASGCIVASEFAACAACRWR
jgi:MoaA/NifB/PqqE/SkfB family radical SAM enzyme